MALIDLQTPRGPDRLLWVALIDALSSHGSRRGRIRPRTTSKSLFTASGPPVNVVATLVDWGRKRTHRDHARWCIKRPDSSESLKAPEIMSYSEYAGTVWPLLDDQGVRHWPAPPKANAARSWSVEEG